MEQQQLSWIAGYFWGVADVVLSSTYYRSVCRAVTLPVSVSRQFKVVFEPTESFFLDTTAGVDVSNVVNRYGALRQVGSPEIRTCTYLPQATCPRGQPA